MGLALGANVGGEATLNPPYRFTMERWQLERLTERPMAGKLRRNLPSASGVASLFGAKARRRANPTRHPDTPLVILNLFQDNEPPPVILKQVQDDEVVGGQKKLSERTDPLNRRNLHLIDGGRFCPCGNQASGDNQGSAQKHGPSDGLGKEQPTEKCRPDKAGIFDRN